MLKRLFSVCILLIAILTLTSSPTSISRGQDKLLKIVVATTDLPAGYLIPEEGVTVCDWPVEAVSQNALTETQQAVQQITRIDIPRGMPVLNTHFGPDFQRKAAWSFKPEASATPFTCPAVDRTVNIVVAAQAMPRLFKISEPAITMRPFPAEAVPPNAIRDPKQVIGKVTGTEIYRDVPILASSVAEGDPALAPCKPGTTVVPAPAAVNKPALTLEASNKPKQKVVGTIWPITNLVFNIAGDRVELYNLLPEGTNLRTFKPTPAIAEVFEKATWKLPDDLTGKPVGNLGLVGPTADLSRRVIFAWLPQDAKEPSTYLWMNPLFALRYAEFMRDSLMAMDRDNAAYYWANYAAFAEQIKVLDQAICDSVATIPAAKRKLVTYHDSFRYFAARYGLTVVAVIQTPELADPMPNQIAALTKLVQTEKVPAVFGAITMPSPAVTLIGKNAKVPYNTSLYHDSLPNATKDRQKHSYVQMLTNNTMAIVDVLGGKSDKLKTVPTANVTGADTAVATPAPAK